MKLFKVVSETLKQYDHQYERGMNILNKEFDNSTKSCSKNGLYCTTIEFIHYYYSYGTKLVEVSFPTNDPKFEVVVDNHNFRSNKLIFDEIHDLFSPETINKFGLKITSLWIVSVPRIKWNAELLTFCLANCNFKNYHELDPTIYDEEWIRQFIPKLCNCNIEIINYINNSMIDTKLFEENKEEVINDRLKYFN